MYGRTCRKDGHIIYSCGKVTNSDRPTINDLSAIGECYRIQKTILPLLRRLNETFSLHPRIRHTVKNLLYSDK